MRCSVAILATRPFLWLRSRLEQLRTETGYLGDAIGDLILNLHYLSRERSVNTERDAVLVAVHHVSFQWYLAFLRKIGIIRGMRIVVIRTGVEMSRLLDGLRSENQPVKLILGRNLYFRYHQLIAADGMGHRARII